MIFSNSLGNTTLRPRQDILPCSTWIEPCPSSLLQLILWLGPMIDAQDARAVAQALEIARESPEGAKDPTVNTILEGALARIWAKIESQPDSYIMTRDEFAVFNYFQRRFEGNETAIAARKRYWDNAQA